MLKEVEHGAPPGICRKRGGAADFNAASRVLCAGGTVRRSAAGAEPG